MHRWKGAVALLVLWVSVGTAQAAEVKPTGPKVSGYIQAWYAFDDSDNLSVDNTFRIRRARLGVSGTITPLVAYKFSTSFEGSSGSLRNAEIHLKLDPLFNLNVGQFNYQFTREGYESSSKRPFILRQNVITHLAEDLGRVGSGHRDVGVEIYGESKAPFGFRYALAVINGNGRNKTDDNNTKDIVGRMILLPAKGLEIGGSFFTGKEQQGSPAKGVDVAAWGLDLDYHQGPFRVRAEYVAGEFDNPTGPSAEPEGWYVLVGYKVTPKFEILAAYDTLDFDKNLSDKTIDQFTIGATYEFKKGTRFMINYIFRDADRGVSPTALFATAPGQIGTTIKSGSTGSDLGNLFLVQMQVAF
jgi:phosphate-selective porin